MLFHPRCTSIASLASCLLDKKHNIRNVVSLLVLSPLDHEQND